MSNEPRFEDIGLRLPMYLRWSVNENLREAVSLRLSILVRK
jgi:hypothetical protein